MQSLLYLGCRLPDGIIDVNEYIKKNGKFYDVPLEVTDKINSDFLEKMKDFNAEDNISWVESSKIIAGN